MYAQEVQADQTLPVGSRESFTWIILKTSIFCLAGWTPRVCLFPDQRDDPKRLFGWGSSSTFAKVRPFGMAALNDFAAEAGIAQTFLKGFLTKDILDELYPIGYIGSMGRLYMYLHLVDFYRHRICVEEKEA